MGRHHSGVPQLGFPHDEGGAAAHAPPEVGPHNQHWCAGAAHPFSHQLVQRLPNDQLQAVLNQIYISPSRLLCCTQYPRSTVYMQHSGTASCCQARCTR